MSDALELTERDDLELKEKLDPTVKCDQIRLIREIVAMANTRGGRIMIGVTDDGRRVGVPEQNRSKWDGARLGDQLDKYLNPERLEVSVAFNRDGCPPERLLIELAVQRYPDPPLVISRTAQDKSGKVVLCKGDVLVRNNTKVERAVRADFVRWRDEDRRRIFEGVETVIRNPTSVVRIVEACEARDPVSYFMSRSVDIFRQRPDKLLDGSDLLHLFTNRATLELISTDSRRLLLHSALRRRATLYFWLALIEASSEEVAGILKEALDMSDRDKSDMSDAIPLVAHLYLSTVQYRELIKRMSTSRYAHIRKAAERHPTSAKAKATVEKRRSTKIDGQLLSDISDELLLKLADLTIDEYSKQQVSKRLTALGLEYLVRQLKQ